MKIFTHTYPPSPVKYQLKFMCKSPTSDITSTFNTILVLLPCPIGYYIDNNSKHQCQCYPFDTERFICSDIGKACVRNGYWFSNVSGVITISKCIPSFCKYSAQRPCPSDITSSDVTDYVLLSHSQDDQCQYGHGGCINGTTVSY